MKRKNGKTDYGTNFCEFSPSQSPFFRLAKLSDQSTFFSELWPDCAISDAKHNEISFECYFREEC